MKTSTLFTLLALIIISCSAFKGKNEKAKMLYEGFIITTKNDTIEGEIQFINPTYNELKVRFFKGGKKEIYEAHQLSGYSFAIKRFNKKRKKKEKYWINYVRKRVQKSPIRQGTTDVFIERQVHGSISLYNFYMLKSTKINKRAYEHVYYIEKEGINGFSMTLISRENYRDAVREHVASGNEKLYNSLGTVGFGYKYLANIVHLQNAWSAGEDVTTIYLDMQRNGNSETEKYADQKK